MNLAYQPALTRHTALVVHSGDIASSLEGIETWDIAVVATVEEAIAALDTGSYDVLLSAVEGEGEGILEVARRRAPETSRILVTDAMASGICDTQCAHQILTAPINAATLEMVLDRAVGGYGQVSLSRVTMNVGLGARLPTLSNSFIRLMCVLDEPNVSADKIARVISSDPVMVARMLQVVNSAFFRLPRKVSSLREAVVYLGINAIRASAVASRCFVDLPEVPADYLERVRTSSLFATQLVRHMGGVNAHDAMTAAILQDIGQILLLSQVDGYKELIDEAECSDVHLHDLEMTHLGITHAHIGATLLASWGLSETVVHAVAFSHTRFPAPADGVDVRTLTYLSAALTLESEAGHSCPELMPWNWLTSMRLEEQIKGWRLYADELSMLWPGA